MKRFPAVELLVRFCYDTDSSATDRSLPLGRDADCEPSSYYQAPEVTHAGTFGLAFLSYKLRKNALLEGCQLGFVEKSLVKAKRNPVGY
jgi:hypothetical protein